MDALPDELRCKVARARLELADLHLHGPLLKALLTGTRGAKSTAPARQTETGIVDQQYDFNFLCALKREVRFFDCLQNVR